MTVYKECDLEKIIESFTVSLDLNKGHDKKELVKLLNNSVKIYTNTKQYKPREPSVYNLFVRDMMAELKITDPTLSARDRMKKISYLWKEEKEKHKIQNMN